MGRAEFSCGGLGVWTAKPVLPKYRTGGLAGLPPIQAPP